MAVLVVTEDLIWRAVVQHRQLAYPLHDLLDLSAELLVGLPLRLLALALDLATEHVRQRLSDALLAPARELAGQLFGLGILDVQRHGGSSVFLLPMFLPSASHNTPLPRTIHTGN